LPLSALLQAAHSQTPPPHLRGPIALAAFVRAILLGKRSAERDLAPGVTESFPQLKPAIDRWLVAPDEPARRFAAAFMMLQNPGMSYYVDPGPGRITRLDQIDSMRDNWWPSRADRSKQPQTYPSFLTADQKQAADEEWGELAAINAPNFLCSEAIAHARRSPNDERVPPALYQCVRAVHLGCSNDQGTAYAKSAFQLLHGRYPESEWARKDHFWYKGDGCT
jgi:hypothetical protein